VSTTKVESADGLDLARFGKQIQLVWTQSGTTDRLLTRIEHPSGKPVSGPQRLVSWPTINTSPSIFAAGGHRLISMSGLNQKSGSEYNSGYQYVLDGGTSGTNFSLQTEVLSNNHYAYGSYGSDTAVSGGTPVQVYTHGSAASVSVHAGFTAYPPSQNTDPHTTGTGPDAYSSGAGTDAKSHKVYAAWYSNDEKAKHLGVHAQQVYPSQGRALHAPRSFTRFNGSPNSVAIDAPTQRVEVAARSKGGLYVGYGVGYPQARRVALWRIGAKKPMLVASGGDANGNVVAVAGSGGRVWLVWHDSGSRRLDVARTATSGKRLAAQCTVAMPSRVTDAFDLAGTADRTGLLVAMTAGNGHKTEVYSRRIEPCKPKKHKHH
jgi:hypothetical protein